LAGTPKQLELTDRTRAELLQDTAPHIDFEGPAFKESLKAVDRIEKAEAATAVGGDRLAHPTAHVAAKERRLGSKMARSAGFVRDIPWTIGGTKLSSRAAYQLKAFRRLSGDHLSTHKSG
jgi:hypothetical protein